MVDASYRRQGAGMHTTEKSVRLIETAQTVELMAFSRDGDPLAMVEIPKDRAEWLVNLPIAMRHAFVAVPGGAGRVIVRAVDLVKL